MKRERVLLFCNTVTKTPVTIYDYFGDSDITLTANIFECHVLCTFLQKCLSSHFAISYPLTQAIT